MFHEVLHAPLVRIEIPLPGITWPKALSMLMVSAGFQYRRDGCHFSRTDFRIVSVVVIGYLGTW